MPVTMLATIRRWVLGATIVAAPLVIAPTVLFDPINTPKMALLVVAVSIAAALRAVETALGRPAAGLRAAWIPVAALTVPLVAAWAASELRGWELYGLYPRYLGVAPYVLFGVFGLLVADAFADRPWTPLWCLLGAGAGMGLYSLIQVAHVDPFVWPVETRVLGIERTASTLGNPNFSGAFEAVATSVGVVVALRGPGRRDWAWVLVGLSAFGLLVSFSQGPWLAGAAGVVVAGAFLFKGRWPQAPRLGAILVAGCALVSVGAVASTIVSDPAADLFGSTVEARGWFWETAARMGAERPLLGWGPNAFALEGIGFRPADEALVAYWIAEDPHNLALSWWASAGLVGLAGVAVAAVWGGRRIVRAIGSDDAVRAAAAAGLTAYAVQGLVSVDEPSLRVALWACVAGIALPVGAQARSESRRSAALVAAPVALGVVVFALWFAFASLSADRSLLRGFRAAQDNQPEEASQNFRAAMEPVALPDYREIYGTKIGELATRAGPEGAALLDEMRAALDYVEEVPDVSALVTRGRLLFAWSEKVDPVTYTEALASFDAARRLDPHHPLLAVEQSDVLRAMGRAGDALELLGSYEQGRGTYAQYHGALALVLTDLERYEEALAEVDAAFEIDDDDPRSELALQRLAEETSG